ncbi:MAG: GNAT family N-acetyltransferase [Phycisphaeraceae bacterium]|nr:GNAT family N-acetyltransferase [Phycisphaeraceae bacterium]
MRCDAIDPDGFIGARTLIDPLRLGRDAPARHLVIRDSADAAQACCSLWPGRAALPDGRVPALVGHYEALSDEAGLSVLAGAADWCARQGRDLCVGPMDGSTWRRYRFVTGGSAEPAFFMEPANPPAYPQQWTRAGFGPMARYESRVRRTDGPDDADTDADLARLHAMGISIRPIDLERFDEELRAVHALSNRAFAENLLATPIDADGFCAMYAPLRTAIRPEFVLIAEQDGRPVGFLFGLPDLAQHQRGVPVDTVLAKSIAVADEARGRRLGSALLELLRRRARDAGFPRIVYALMHEDNRSLAIVGHRSRPLREYALFGRSCG